jgi:hypothetical protein
MKVAGFTAIIILCTLIFLSGCVQVIINPPGTPGVIAPGITPATVQPVADDTPVPVAPAKTIQDTPAPAATGNPKFIVPIGDLSRVGQRSFAFWYAPESMGPQEYSFRVPVNMSVYYGARQMKIDVPSSSMNPAEIKQYISTFGKDPAMDELYNSILTQLRSARQKNGGYLSDDEYLELIVAFVQQIPFVENSSPKRKYPIEVIYEKSGDSDEKSMLLANLLSREGYDVSLMVFEDLQFETIGIHVVNDVPDSSLKVYSDGKKDYIFIDASQPAFIGAVPRKPIDFMNVEEPAIYPVGKGTKSYGPVNYVWKVVADLHRLSELGTISDPHIAPIHPWDKTGTCMKIKNSKLLMNTTCYCCDM